MPHVPSYPPPKYTPRVCRFCRSAEGERHAPIFFPMPDMLEGGVWASCPGEGDPR